ncbi:hypothetical protein TW95_gp1017 [Pandoravirus inopinatum]|uniref:Uncharacterized protein n=1 Tax=Pandoravirus inopinatum TaxID=1605721 RepID=A0A0B5JA41_9VIRU|nr:hypothetical protein TW95_gp1017 [Pandoravirus inopinatum]AJF97751.1 hypothetical protein [Pandoravirus inopinatum]
MPQKVHVFDDRLAVAEWAPTDATAVPVAIYSGALWRAPFVQLLLSLWLPQQKEDARCTNFSFLKRNKKRRGTGAIALCNNKQKQKGIKRISTTLGRAQIHP